MTENIRNECDRERLVCIPSFYFDGYFPTISSIHGINSAAGLVHDIAVFHAFDPGFSSEETTKILYEQDVFGADFNTNAWQQSLKGLQQRESEHRADVSVSDIIETSGRERVLMHQFNHPVSEVFSILAPNRDL